MNDEIIIHKRETPDIPYETLMSRIKKQGYTEEETLSVPVNMRRWQWKLERETDKTLETILREAADSPVREGNTLMGMARKLGVHHQTLRHHANKYGIRFPRYSGYGDYQRKRGGR